MDWKGSRRGEVRGGAEQLCAALSSFSFCHMIFSDSWVFSFGWDGKERGREMGSAQSSVGAGRFSFLHFWAEKGDGKDRRRCSLFSLVFS